MENADTFKAQFNRITHAVCLVSRGPQRNLEMLVSDHPWKGRATTRWMIGQGVRPG